MIIAKSMLFTQILESFYSNSYIAISFNELIVFSWIEKSDKT